MAYGNDPWKSPFGRSPGPPQFSPGQRQGLLSLAQQLPRQASFLGAGRGFGQRPTGGRSTGPSFAPGGGFGQTGYSSPPQQPASGTGPSGHVAASIQPGGIYPAEYTQRAGNLAGALLAPSQQFYQAQAMQPGVSVLSPMTGYRAGVGMGGAMAQSMMAPQEVAQQHQFANAQNQLRGQVQRDQEGLGWGQLGLQDLAGQYQYGDAQTGNLIRFLNGASQWWR